MAATALAILDRPEEEPPLQVIIDPVESARAAGLRYYTDQRPGIRRRRAGMGFVYTDHDGATIRDAGELARIKSLAIPPAWTDVWICPSPRGHIQATGRDAKGRKQYRYHPRWREVRDETKYTRMIAFGEALPHIRARVDQDLSLRGIPREKVLATIVRLLDETAIRVGNEEYARENKSFGLTTLRNRHVDISGSTLRFHFRGKSGKEHNVGVRDRKLARAVRHCLELPGYELFQYVDDDGQRHSVDSVDVNDYLREISGQDFTAKDFRTWTGTVIAARALYEIGPCESVTERNKRIAHAIEEAARHLGNTKTICRKCYVHPDVLDAYADGSLSTLWEEAERHPVDGLDSEESATLAILRRRHQ